MDIHERNLIRLIDLVYSAVEDPGLWSHILGELASKMKAHIAAFYVHDIESCEGNALWSAGVDPAYLHLYDQYYHTKNIWTIRAARTLIPGSILMSHEVCPDAEVLKTEYYSDFLTPLDAFHNIGATIVREGPVAGMLTVIRPRRANHFEEHELFLLRALMPHLARALQLRRRLSCLEVENATSREMLDRLDVGVLSIDPRGRVKILNRAAQSLLDQKDGIRLEVDGLRASTTSETIALRRLLSRATSKETASGGSIRISRRSSVCPLEIIVAPARLYTDVFETRRPSALVIVVDPGATPKVSIEALRQLFDLSPAEANFACLLVAGGSVKELAEELGISMNTARTHLKRILLKIGGKRQAEVVLKILRSSAIWR